MENDKTTLQKPGFWRLMGAYAIDYLVFVLVCLCVVGMLMLARYFADHGDYDQGRIWGFLIIFGPLLELVAPIVAIVTILGGAIVPPFYFAGMGVLKGGSLGKMVTGLGVTPCSFGRIFGAYMLDMIFIAVGVVVFFFASATVIHGANSLGLGFVPKILLSGVNLFFPVLYFAVLENSFGCSLGKLICGLRVYKK